MDSAGFDPTCWNHWLLIGCFLGLSTLGLYFSWQWRNAAAMQRRQAKLARRLALELNNMNRLRMRKPLAIRQGAVRTSSGTSSGTSSKNP
jgi:hypothetical protein